MISLPGTVGSTVSLAALESLTKTGMFCMLTPKRLFSCITCRLRFDLRSRFFPQPKAPEDTSDFSSLLCNLPVSREIFSRVAERLDVRHVFASHIIRGSPVLTRITGDKQRFEEEGTCKTIRLPWTNEAVWLIYYSLRASDWPHSPGPIGTMDIRRAEDCRSARLPRGP